MYKFKNAIVRLPCKNMIHGITTAGLGIPDFDLALKQHQNYTAVLKSCGLQVTVLPPDERFPDSVFVEDIALITPHCIVITRPAISSRMNEINGIRDIAVKLNRNIEEISSPGTLEGGDVLMAGTHFFIGLSGRTNTEGALQLINILEKYGMTGSTVELKDFLHLKSGVAYLGNNCLLASGEMINKSEFLSFNILKVNEDESYAANCVRINDYVIVPEGFPESRKMIEDAGFRTKSVNVSEFRKLDGGLSCLSLRF